MRLLDRPGPRTLLTSLLVSLLCKAKGKSSHSARYLPTLYHVTLVWSQKTLSLRDLLVERTAKVCRNLLTTLGLQCFCAAVKVRGWTFQCRSTVNSHFFVSCKKNQVKYSVSFSASATEVNKVAKALLIKLYLTKCTCNNLTNSIQYRVFHTWLPATGSPPTACDTVSGTFSFFDPLSHYLNSFWKD